MNRSSYRRWPVLHRFETGHLLSQPFNSSTPVLYYNKDAFKKAGLDPEQPPKTWQDLAAYTAKLKPPG
ncbi:glycerol-3-phosphate ABC transporter [Klebsiella pneumoniae]|uniref:sn-glycerol-3-phosphate-binding periplasmic protein UgpB n=1 Tax=Klebsiella pneumoniae TaxID=573 RepID=A0A4P0YHU8_KLEPN|nr:glycerol-3-phosphate ABC transporter [Klebsiella pneumoniae]